MAVACCLLASSARAAAPAASPASAASGSQLLRNGATTPLDQLVARAAKLASQYRGRLEMLTGVEAAAEKATARVVRLDRQLAAVHRQLARTAEASYMGEGSDPLLSVFMDTGNPQQLLGKTAIVEYLAHQRDDRQQELQQLIAAANRAQQAAQAKVADLRQMITALVSQQKRIERLLAQYQPQSPTIGDNITPRMREVRNEIDSRFGPFVDIGCWRPGNDGEHPLGRACDFMLSTGGVMPTAANIQRGYDIAAWAQANASRLGIMYIIYRQRIWDIRSGSSSWVPMEDRGSITANHFDHVHISVF
jgi:phage shock protein A